MGAYGVVTYSVTRRTPEIDARMALGADGGRTFQLVVFGALKVVLIDVVLGSPVQCRWDGRSSTCFGVPLFDVLPFAVPGPAIVAVGACAAAVQAVRAAGIDPCALLGDCPRASPSRSVA